MKRLFAICCLCLALFVSCDDRNVSGKIAVIDIGSNAFNMEKIYLGDYASEIRYIPLEEQMNYLLGSAAIFYADFSGDYIVDSDGLKCMLYDRNGHLIRMVGQQGRGPGEYNGISSVFLIGDNIYIHDYFTDDLIEYKTDGSFVDRHNSGFTVDGKYRLEDAYIINDTMIIGNYKNRTGHEEYKAFLFEKNGTIIEAYKNYISFNLAPEVEQTGSPGRTTCFRFKNNIFFKEGFNDTLFRLSSDNHLEPCYIFDLGKYKLPVSNLAKGVAQMDQDSYISILRLLQTERFVFLVCNYGKYFTANRLTVDALEMPSGGIYNRIQNWPYMLGVYDKETGNLAFSEPTDTDNPLYSSGFYNDIDAGPRFMPGKMVNDSTMAMKIDFYELMKHVESDDFRNNIPKNPEQKEKLVLLIDSLKKTDFDNPVYMLVTFKNN